MNGFRWCASALAAAIGTVVLFCTAGVANAADDRVVEQLIGRLDEMKARLERVEKQNDELRNGQPGAPPGIAPVAAEPAKGEKERVNSLIDSYMRDKAAAKKAEDDQKAKQVQDEGVAVGSVLGMTPVWNNGVYFETPSKDFRFHIGGTVHMDAAGYLAPDDLKSGPGSLGGDFFQAGTNIRRGRLRAEGTAWEVVDFLFELEFFNGVALPSTTNPPPNGNVFNTPGPTDAWITMKQLPIIGNLRVGNMKTPFSLEHIASYRYLEFLERSIIFDAFVPNTFDNGFNPGVMAFDNWGPDRRGTWFAGLFRASSDPYGFTYGKGGALYSGRATYLVYDGDESHFAHLGAALPWVDYPTAIKSACVPASRFVMGHSRCSAKLPTRAT